MGQAINLDEIDLVRTMIPPGGINIEIDGCGKMGVEIPNIRLIDGIAHVYSCKVKKTVSITKEFLARVTVLDFDTARRYIKVAVAEE